MSEVRPVVARAATQLAEALALPAAEARECQVQHALAGRLREIARRQKYTHTEIAARSGTSRSRVTAILNGDLEHVSTDLLIRILAGLGYRVKVSVVKSANAA